MVHSHPNARLTPAGRAHVFVAVEAGATVVAACLMFGVSRRWYYRWTAYAPDTSGRLSLT